jgi:hypothetical protein
VVLEVLWCHGAWKQMAASHASAQAVGCSGPLPNLALTPQKLLLREQMLPLVLECPKS